MVGGSHAQGLRRRLAGPLLIAVSALVLVAPVRAGDFLRLYGGENVGTSSGVFLRIPVGARAVALGQAYSASAYDGSSIFWNPAGIMRAPGRKNFFFSHSEYTAGIDLNYAAYHMHGLNFGYGLSVGVLSSGDILRTDELHQEGTGSTFNANQIFVGLTIARAMTDRFSIGATAKYYQENLDQYQMKAVLADLGILYFVGWHDLRIGFYVHNFGTDLKPGGTPPPLLDGYQATGSFQSFPAPTEGAFGLARTWQFSEHIGLMTAMDFNHPSDAQETFRLGGELGLRERLYLRAGYEIGRDEGGLAAGFGLTLSRKNFLLRIDYAYSDLGSFGTIHHISVDLSPLTKRRPVDNWRHGRER